MMPLRAPPVFLDRDGTLIVEKHFLSDPAGVSLEEGVPEGLALLQSRGHPLIVLSNQSGIGRGLFDESAAQRVNLRVAELLKARNIEILGWYVCPHTPEEGCDCRKPLPGMALAASRDLKLDLPGSFMVGDRRGDLELADAIGATGILVASGYGRSAVEWARGAGRPVFDDFKAAAEYIAAHGSEA
jgi:histidinol-phosphate phosphatase family protein